MQWTGAMEFEQQRIIVPGRLATAGEVNQHLALCDVYLQPSLWDGMPNALLEAMAAGCAVIGSDAGGIPELITHGVDGIVVPRWQLHRLGDVVLLPFTATAFLDPADTGELRLRARHGSLTPAEMLVPLLSWPVA